jgi:hypothetical protein
MAAERDVVMGNTRRRTGEPVPAVSGLQHSGSAGSLTSWTMLSDVGLTPQYAAAAGAAPIPQEPVDPLSYSPRGFPSGGGGDPPF